jgi:filamentous hemagglutinin
MAGAFMKVADGVVSGESIGLSWSGNWFDRGYVFENYIASLPEFALHRLPPKFKTFDFFDKSTRKAVSVKTLDTNTISRIANPDLVRHQVNGYINKMIDFERAPYRNGTGKFLENSEISSKELHMAIPANTSPIHMQQIMHSVQYGVDNGVKVIVIKVK